MEILSKYGWRERGFSKEMHWSKQCIDEGGTYLTGRDMKLGYDEVRMGVEAGQNQRV